VKQGGKHSREDKEKNGSRERESSGLRVNRFDSNLDRFTGKPNRLAAL